MSKDRQYKWIKTKADSTLLRMSKTELIEYIRMCEDNAEAAMQTVYQQAVNVQQLLDTMKVLQEETDEIIQNN